MVKVIVQHHVADYDRWYPVYIEHGSVRRRHGGTGHTITRSVDDPNLLVVLNDFASLDGARAFAQDPSLQAAMGQAGVDSEPTIWFVEEAETTAY